MHAIILLLRIVQARAIAHRAVCHATQRNGAIWITGSATISASSFAYNVAGRVQSPSLLCCRTHSRCTHCPDCGTVLCTQFHGFLRLCGFLRMSWCTIADGSAGSATGGFITYVGSIAEIGNCTFTRLASGSVRSALRSGLAPSPVLCPFLSSSLRLGEPTILL